MTSTKTEEPGTELEVVQDWTPFLLGDETPEFADPEQASRDIVMQILAAPDMDAVLDMAGTTPIGDLINVPIRILDARAMRSAYEQGATMYLLLTVAELETGDVRKVTCGARNVMAQLYRWDQLGRPEFECVCRPTDKPTANGYYPLWLKRVSS